MTTCCYRGKESPGEAASAWTSGAGLEAHQQVLAWPSLHSGGVRATLCFSPPLCLPMAAENVAPVPWAAYTQWVWVKSEPQKLFLSSWPLSGGLLCFVSFHSVEYSKSLTGSQNAEWCTVMFFFSCALTYFLGSPSVPWLLSPSVLPEEGTFCFQRRAITAGCTFPDASPVEGICLRATSVPCHELAKMPSPEGQHHFKGEAPS